MTFSGFLTGENILFFVICGVLVLLAVTVFSFVAADVFSFLKRLFKKVFYKAALTTAPKEESRGAVAQETEENKKEKQDSKEQEIKPGPKLQYENYSSKPKEKESEKSGKQTFNEKEKQDIQAGLDKLKSSKPGEEEKETLSSKMPSREDVKSGEDREIKIPVPKKFGRQTVSSSAQEMSAPKIGTKAGPSAGAVPQNLKNNSVPNNKSSVVTKDKGIIKTKLRQEGTGPKNIMQRADPKERLEIGKPKILEAGDNKGTDVLLEKPDILTEDFDLNPQVVVSSDSKPRLKSSVNKSQISSSSQDGSIFSGKSEIPRRELEHEMKFDPKIWQAAKQVGLGLSPVQRAKLVKEVFSSALGRNISKTDLKLSIKKLNQKMVGAKDSQTHAKLRKEVKFFKKIGGIK